jgi:integrase
VKVYDRWHLAHPPAGAKKCSDHRKVPSAQHGIGLRYQVRGKDEDGAPIPKQSFMFEKDAKDYAAKARTDVNAGTFVDERLGKITFKAYAERWRAGRVHDPSTAQRIKSTFTNHVYEGETKGRTPNGSPSIGQVPLRRLARQVSLMQDWIKGIPGSPNTALQIVKDVSQVLRAAVDDKLIPDNPLKAGSIQKPDAVRREAISLTRDELDALADALPGVMQAMAWLGANCGHRQGELAGCAVEDLDFLRRVCHVGWQVKHVNLTGVPDVGKAKRPAPLSGWSLVYSPTKNEKSRDVPIAVPVIPVLSEHLRRHPPVAVTLPYLRHDGKIDGDLTRSLVFTNRGRAWWTGTNYAPWHRARTKAGLPEDAQVYGWHALRHTAASQWLGGGLSLARTASYLGDTQEVVLSTYSHFLPEEEDRARVIMDEFFKPSTERRKATGMPDAAGEAELWLFKVHLQDFSQKF